MTKTERKARLVHLRKAKQNIKMAIAELRVDGRESYRLPLASLVGQAVANLKDAASQLYKASAGTINMRDETLAMMRTYKTMSVSELIDDPFEVQVLCTLSGKVESVRVTLAY